MTVAAGSVTDSLELRNREPKIKQVWKREITFSAISTDETATVSINLNGILRHVTYLTPNTANNNLTSEMTISDSAGNERFTTGSGIVEDDLSNYSVDEPFAESVTIAITFNEAVGFSANFVVTLWGI